MRLHWGPPKHVGQMKFATGLSMRDKSGERREQYSTREMTKLYGVSSGDWFFGIITFGRWGSELSPASPTLTRDTTT